MLFNKRATCYGCRYFLRIFGVLCAFQCLYALRLSKPRILLPFNYGLPSNYTISVPNADSTDCFEWHSSNTHQVIVSPIYKNSDGCSNKAIISAINSARSKLVVRVTATLIGNTEEILHCDVILETPHSIKLSSLTNEIRIGGPPELLSITASDENGHPFTSINGLLFDWNIRHEADESSEEVDRTEVARLKRFSDSNGWASLFSSSSLLEAINVGTCFVSATLKNMGKDISTGEIQFIIVPSYDVYPSRKIILLHSASVDVYVRKLKNGVPDGKLDDYSLETGETTVTGTNYGVEHTNFISNNPSLKPIPIEYKVVKPSRMDFRISRGGFTHLEMVKTYVISIEIIDEEGNEIYPSDNLRVLVHFPAKQFYVHSSTPNGTYHVVQAVAPGKAVIKAEFKGVLLEDETIFKEHELVNSLKVSVLNKMEIYPHTPFIFLPTTESTTGPLYEINMTMTGGSGLFSWSTDNISAAHIRFKAEESEKARLEILKESEFSLTVTDMKNINHRYIVKVAVQPVTDIEVYPTVVEGEIQSTLILPVALLGHESKDSKVIRKFDDCSKVEPTVEIIEKHVIRYDPDPHIPGFGKGCLSLNLKCTSAGYSRINVSYKTFKTTTVVACFKPLKPVHPVRVAVLGIGASLEIAFEGGPRKFPLFKEGHYTRLEASDPDLVDMQLIKDPIRYNKDLTVFRVRCKALGENTLTFKIGNEPSATNAHPASAETSIKVICSQPHSVHMKLYRTNTKREKLPDNVVKVPFYGNKEFSVDVYVKDAMGRKFANISSFSVTWTTSDEELGAPDGYSGFKTHENAVAGYRKVSRNFKDFKMKGGAGKLKVKVVVEGYRKDVLAKEGISAPAKFKEISTSLDLDLVSLRDINAGLYSSNGEKSNEVSSCDADTCKS